MKKDLFLLFLVFSFSFSLSAQDGPLKSRKNRIGITYSSLGSDDVIDFRKGGASYNSDGFYSIGINYLSQISNRWDFEAGIEYGDFSLIVRPNLPPNLNGVPYSVRFSLVNVPVSLRLNFLKYFFINGGFNFDFDASASMPIDSQTGVGSLLGVGFDYEFKNGMSAFVNPYFKIHSLISFSAQSDHQRILEGGFRFGIMYNLKYSGNHR